MSVNRKTGLRPNQCKEILIPGFPGILTPPVMYTLLYTSYCLSRKNLLLTRVLSASTGGERIQSIYWGFSPFMEKTEDCILAVSNGCRTGTLRQIVSIEQCNVKQNYMDKTSGRFCFFY